MPRPSNLGDVEGGLLFRFVVIFYLVWISSSSGVGVWWCVVFFLMHFLHIHFIISSSTHNKYIDGTFYYSNIS